MNDASDSPRVPEAAQPEKVLVGAPDKERPDAREEGRVSLRAFTDYDGGCDEESVLDSTEDGSSGGKKPATRGGQAQRAHRSRIGQAPAVALDSGISTTQDERYVVSDERLAEIESMVVFDANDDLKLAFGVTTVQAAGALYDLLEERRERAS